MKKMLVSILLGLSLGTVVFAQKTELVFNTQEFSPFNYSLNGKAAGPAVDIINEICRQINLTCTYNVLPWDKAQKMVKKGNADGLFVVGKNKQREKWLNFSLPIMKTEYGFFVLNSNPLEYKNISDMQGYHIGVFGPSNTSLSLKAIDKQLRNKKLKSLVIRVLTDDVPVFKQLNQEDKLEAVYSNKDVGNAIIKENKLSNLKYAGKHKELDYHIAFSKKTVPSETVMKFNEALMNMYKTNRLKEILNQYNLEQAVIK